MQALGDPDQPVELDSGRGGHGSLTGRRGLAADYRDCAGVERGASSPHKEKWPRGLAQELAKAMFANVIIDGGLRENVRAQLWVRVERILQRYAYPFDDQGRATELVLDQADALSVSGATAT